MRRMTTSTVSCTPVVILAADGTPDMTGCVLPDASITRSESIVSLDFTRTVTLPSGRAVPAKDSDLPLDEATGSSANGVGTMVAVDCMPSWYGVLAMLALLGWLV